VDGQNVMSLNESELIELRRRKMGMVFQSFGLLPHRTVLDNVQMGLAKADMNISALYANLTDEHTRDVVFNQLHTEFERTLRVVLDIAQVDYLLENEARLARSIKLRNPYVDPLNMLQVGLLQKLRTEPDSALVDRWRESVLMAVNGIAAGLQNTG
ncbi:MAG: phosphoenolpyruvate carboxylase, partial [Caldilineaceae bacterium]|nr:phosphoenolpyruvate carboxylase [Caldilineaceae bacterium]